jgi:hypothetical protein
MYLNQPRGRAIPGAAAATDVHCYVTSDLRYVMDIITRRKTNEFGANSESF